MVCFRPFPPTHWPFVCLSDLEYLGMYIIGKSLPYSLGLLLEPLLSLLHFVHEEVNPFT